MRDFSLEAVQTSNEMIPYAFRNLWNDNVPLDIAKELLQLLVIKHRLDLNRFTSFADYIIECIQSFYDMNPGNISEKIMKYHEKWAT